MAFLSLTVKSRRGVPVNEVQLIDLDDIVSPISSINGGADSSFILSEYKKGPFANFTDKAYTVEYVVDQTLSQIASAAVGYIFTADVISVNGRAPKVPTTMGFNSQFVSGVIDPVNSAPSTSKFKYQVDGNPDLVTYIVNKNIADILTQITLPPVGIPGTTYIFTNGLTESGGIVKNDYYTGEPTGLTTQNIWGSQQANGVFIINSTTNATKGVIQFGNGLNTAVYREDNGRLGIGVSNPSGIIGLDGQSGNQTIIMERTNTNGANGSSLKIKASSVSSSPSAGTSGGALILSAGDSSSAGGGSGDIQFQVSDNSSSGAAITKAILKGNGFLGVGTTNPTNTLHVNGTFRLVDGFQTLGAVLCDSDGLGTARWQILTIPAQGWELYGNGGGGGKFLGTTDYNDLPIRAANSENMRIHRDGYVLVNMSVPVGSVSILQVTGRIMMLDGNQAAGKVMTSDSAGNASWQNPVVGFTNPMTTTGDIIQATAGGTAVRLPAVAVGNVLISGGVASPISWGKVDLSIHTTGILAQINGGTGFSTYNLGDLLVGISGNLVKLPVGANGQVLTVSGGTAIWSTPTTGFTNPMIDIGDMIQGSTGGAPVRIAAVAAGNVLLSGGVSSSNNWGKVGLSTHVSGILPQSFGGTGFNTYALGDILVGSSGNFVKLPIGASGQVLTVSGGTAIWQNPVAGFVNPMTTVGDIIQATTGGAAVRLAAVATGNALISGGVASPNSWGKIGLTTHVSGVLPILNGGTGYNAWNTGDIPVGGPGSILYQYPIGSSGQVLTVSGGTISWQTPTYTGWAINGNTVSFEKYIGTIDNFDFPVRTNNIEVARFTKTGRVGIGTVSPTSILDVQSTTIKGLNVQVTGAVGASITSSVLALSLVGGNGGIDIVNNGTLPGIKITTSLTNASGILVDTYTGIGVYSNSKFYTAGLFSQTGSLTSNNTSDLLALYRNFSLNAFDATGSVLLLNDDTASSGPFMTVVKAGVTKLVIKSTGVLQYIDGNQAAGKVLTSDSNGNASWQTGGGGTSYTFSTGLTLVSTTVTANLSTGVVGGQSVIGGTAANNALTLSSTSNASKGKILFGTSTYNEFNNRLGINTQTPGAIVDIFMTNGATGFRLTNSDATTAAGGTIVGWMKTVVTNGANTNMDLYEQDSTAGITKRMVWHTGGNVTVGNGSGNGDARFHVIGNVKIADGTQGVGKVFTSDANGLGSWQTPSFVNPMTTIADIIQANTGGVPQRLAGSATAGTFLRSQGTGVQNNWSNLILPNSATAGRIVYATGANTWGESPNFYYDGAYVYTTASANGGSGAIIQNLNSGTNAFAILYINGSFSIRKYGINYPTSGTISIPDQVEFRNNRGMKFTADFTDPSPSTSSTSVFSWYLGYETYATSERMRLSSGGLSLASIGVSVANADTAKLLDMSSTTQGVGFPRMTTAQRTAIPTTSKPGIVVFDTDTNQLMVTNNSGTWVAL